jgi:hypothetical protein
MQWIEEHGKYYICGIPGNYAIKSQGNNRIIFRDIATLADARAILMVDSTVK